MSCPYILNESGITLIIKGKSQTVSREDNAFSSVMAALKEQDWDKLERLVDKISAIQTFGKGRITVHDGQVFFEDEAVFGFVIDKILSFIEEGLDANPLLNFLDKIMDNPSKRVVDQLYSFLSHGNMPLDPDGDFYAYKAVRDDWTDKYTGKIKNDIGSIVSVPRRTVDDNHDVGCSYGLHAGDIEYVRSFGNGSTDRILIVKINPKDVVTVPSEDTRKLRCCSYQVVSVYEGVLPQNTYRDSSLDENEEEFDDEDDFYEDDFWGTGDDEDDDVYEEDANNW
jgi:hypothetical protein